MEISKIYEPKEVEKKWLKDWEDKKLYTSCPDERPPFTVVIPPPNVTGSLHMGHALNNLLQDIIIRFKRMNGFNACWVPGTDHGGIATQNVKEKELKKEEKKRDDFTQDQFVELMKKWAMDTGKTILMQLNKLGCSCDWDKTSFTMDEKRSKTVNTAFIELFNKGLIYRGFRWVDWCIRCETALNESEYEQEDEKGKLWYIKYPIVPGSRKSPSRFACGEEVGSSELITANDLRLTDFITVATTRPETMLGDTAVAVNPDDKRYKKFVGKNAVIPLVNRIIPIIADETVDVKFGTGAVKITPAHDQNDDATAKRHNLVYIGAIDTKGKIAHGIIQDLKGKIIENNEVSDLIGKNRDEARKIIIDRLKDKGFLEKEEDYTGPKKRCYRCETIVESFSSMQWFLKMDDMAKRAVGSAKNGETKFFPERWLNPYLLWLENLKDWCISRQIWWGHRIPLWYCPNCAEEHVLFKEREGVYIGLSMITDENEKKQIIQKIKNGSIKYLILNVTKDTDGVHPSETQPNKCSFCGKSDFIQDPDVLDTWFSSALWPLSVFGWPEETKELKYYYPTNVLVTGHEILYLWVARMIMFGLEFKNKVPYSNVYIHGIVRDSKGKKMSKSLGNVIDPLDIMEKFGTDALRLALAFQAVPGRDMQISDENFIMARNFTNKLWNASRFVLMNIQTTTSDFRLPTSGFDLTDKWILSELNLTIKNITESIENYNPAEAARILYEFIWSKYCDWYVEFSKTRFAGTDGKSKLAAQKVHLEVLEKILQMLHPIMPFITEEIFQSIKHRDGSIMISKYPEPDAERVDPAAQLKIQKIMDAVTLIRNFTAEMNIKPENLTCVYFKTSDDSKKIILDNIRYLEILTKIKKEAIKFRDNLPHISSVLGDIQFLPELNLTAEDTEKIIKRLESQLQKIDKELRVYGSKISNENFIQKADPAEVERIRQKHTETSEKKKKIEESIKTFGGKYEKN